MQNFQIEIDDRDVRDVLRRATAALSDPSDLMADIAEALASESERQFRDESGPTGAKWPDLAESTKRQRARRGKWPGEILQLSAAGLAASVVAESDRDSATLTVGVPYAAIHQFGGRAGRGGRTSIEPRPYLPLLPSGGWSPALRETILELANQHIQDAIDGR